MMDQTCACTLVCRTKLWHELPELPVADQEAAVCASEQGELWLKTVLSLADHETFSSFESCLSAESCEVLDTSSYVTTVALIKNGTRYFVEYLESGE